jgi:hypothetical protein
MDGWMDGWMAGKAGLRIAYSNQKSNFFGGIKNVLPYSAYSYGGRGYL